MGLFGSLGGSLVGAGLGQALAGSRGAQAGQDIGRQIGQFLPFKTGGKVPGPKGKPRKAIVHGGETVLPVGVKPTAAQKKAIRMRGGKV